MILKPEPLNSEAFVPYGQVIAGTGSGPERHAPRTAIALPGEFIMFRWDDGSAVDTEKRPLQIPIEVEL